MSGYVITNMKIKNHEKYKDYIKSVIPSVKKYKGQYLFRGGRVKKFLEGKWKYKRFVVIKFPSYKKALDWYNSKDYARIKDIRHKYADSNLVILKGLI